METNHDKKYNLQVGLSPTTKPSSHCTKQSKTWAPAQPKASYTDILPPLGNDVHVGTGGATGHGGSTGADKQPTTMGNYVNHAPTTGNVRTTTYNTDRKKDLHSRTGGVSNATKQGTPHNPRSRTAPREAVNLPTQASSTVTPTLSNRIHQPRSLGCANHNSSATTARTGPRYAGKSAEWVDKQAAEATTVQPTDSYAVDVHRTPSRKWWSTHRDAKVKHRVYAGSVDEARQLANNVKLSIARDPDTWSTRPIATAPSASGVRVEDGFASPAEAFKLRMGLAPPRQFVPGGLGQNTAYSRSSNREAIATTQLLSAPAEPTHTTVKNPQEPQFLLSQHARTASVEERLTPEGQPVPAWVVQLVKHRATTVNLWR